MKDYDYWNNYQIRQDSLVLNILLKPRIILNLVGFELDEHELTKNRHYYIKNIEKNSLSDIAGLQMGDKIVKINGKPTIQMNYFTFCSEILIARDDHKLNNLLRLVVTRNKSSSNLLHSSNTKKRIKKNKSLHESHINSKLTHNNSNVVKSLKKTKYLLKHGPIAKQYNKEKSLQPVKANIIYNHQPHVSRVDQDIEEKATPVASSIHKTVEPVEIFKKEETIINYKIKPEEKKRSEDIKVTQSEILNVNVTNQYELPLVHEKTEIFVENSKQNYNVEISRKDAVVEDKIYQKLENELNNYMKISNEPEPEPEFIEPGFVLPPPLPLSQPPRRHDSREAESGETLTMTKSPELSMAVLSKLIVHANQHVPESEKLEQKIENQPLQNVDEQDTYIEARLTVTETKIENLETNEEIGVQFVEKPSVQENDIEHIRNNLKLYRVEKKPNYFGFGIILHTERDDDEEYDDDDDHGIIQEYYPILEIEENSPAYDAGLKTDQRLLAVNKKYINTDFKTIEELAQCIDECYYQQGFTEFLVIDDDDWDLIKYNNELVKSICMPQYSDDKISNESSVNEQEQEQGQEQEQEQEIQEQISNANDTNSKNEEEVLNVEIVEEIEPISPPITEDKRDKMLPRFCHLVRGSQNEQYGFDFKTIKIEGKHVAINVRDEFPAQKAGLKNGDFIIEINSKKIEFEEHEKVVNLIYSREKDVDLLVVEDLKGYKNILNQQEKLISDLNLSKKSSDNLESNDANDANDIFYHRIILMDTYKGIGLHLTANGVISYIEPLSPAQISGIAKGEKVMKINDIDVSSMNTRDIAKLIKDNINDLVIGIRKNENELVEKDTIRDEYVEGKAQPVANVAPILYENVGPILAASSSIKSDEFEEPTLHTRICNLIIRPDFTGFGFGLKNRKTNPHQVANIAPDSPADVSGLQNDDLLIKIDGISVVGEKYSTTVLRIKNGSEMGRIELEVARPKEYENINELQEKKVTDDNKVTKQENASSPIMSSSVKSKEFRNPRNENFYENRQSTYDDSLVNETQPEINQRTNEPSPRTPEIVTIKSDTMVGIRRSQSESANENPISSSKSNEINKASTISLSTSKFSPKFKRCTVFTSVNYTGFGFKINKELKPKYMICTIEPNSPADRANVAEKDVLIEINNKNIRRSKFDKVRALLSEAASVGKVDLLLISMEGYLWYKAKNKRFSTKLTTPNNVEYYSTTDRPEISQGGLENNQESNTTEDILSITIRKVATYNGYGMALSLITSKASNFSFPIVTKIESGSPAEQSSLKTEDMIVAINGNDTNQQSNDMISSYIKNSGDTLNLTVKRKNDRARTSKPPESSLLTNEAHRKIEERNVDGDDPQIENNDTDSADERQPRNLEESREFDHEQSNSEINDYENERGPQIIRNRIEMSSSKIQASQSYNEPLSKGSPLRTSDAPIPRLCRIRTYESNLGFVVKRSKKDPSIFKVADIQPNSSADNSGLRNGDYIIEINGSNVQSMTDSELFSLIKMKKDEDNLQMLVADEDTIEWYRNQNIPISSSMVPKLTYIETILQEEMEKNMVDSANTTNRNSRTSTEINDDHDYNDVNQENCDVK